MSVIPEPLGKSNSRQVDMSVTQLPRWLIILLPGLVRSRVFQLAVKLAKIFERKWKSNWKVQAST